MLHVPRFESDAAFAPAATAACAAMVSRSLGDLLLERPACSAVAEASRCGQQRRNETVSNEWRGGGGGREREAAMSSQL